MLERADSNNDGKISFEDFYSVMVKSYYWLFLQLDHLLKLWGFFWMAWNIIKILLIKWKMMFASACFIRVGLKILSLEWMTLV